MKIHFFGRAGDRIARSVEIDVPSDVASVGALRIFLAGAYPDAAEEIASPALRACIGDTIVTEDHVIGDCSVIEFVPPLSGG